MKLLFVFCCLSAGCVIWTEASPFFFNLQKTVIPQTTQIQRRPVVTQGTNFGLGGLISKWFPSIVINKQFGTRRPKATQRPVIEVTTIFVPVDLEKEDTNESLGSSARPIEEISSTTTTTEQPFEEIFNNSEKTTTTSTTTTEEAFEEIFDNSEKTSTTTTEGPFEEIFNNSEKTTTTTTEEPFEEIFNNSEKTTTTTSGEPFEEIFNNSEKTTTTTSGEPFEEIFNNSKETTTSTTAVPFEEIEPFTESKTTTTTTELPFEETEPLPAIVSSTDKGTEQYTQIKTTTTTTTTTELPFEETEDSNENTYSTTNVALPSFTESKTTTTTTTTEVPLELSEIFTASKIPTTITTGSYEYSVGSKTSTTSTTSTELPSQESEISNNAEFLINQIGFTTEGSIPLTSTEVIQSNNGYLSSNSDKEQIVAIKPTTYRPLFVPTATNAPWKETPSNIINTGGLVEANKPPESYVYVRPDISADDILLNEVSSNSRPFETLSVVGTTRNGKRVERIYKPQAAAVERPRVTFYSNY